MDNQTTTTTPGTEAVTAVSKTTTSSKHQKGAPKNRNRGFKRPHQADQNDLPPSKRSQSEFTKKPNTPLLYSYFIQPFYSIFISNRGALSLCENMYSILQGRDRKLTDMLPLSHLQYVTAVALTARMVRIATWSGTSICTQRDELFEAADGILLPDFLAVYIESIGQVDLFGVKVVPYMSDLVDMYESPAWYRYDRLLDEDQRPNNHWQLNRAVILQYMSSIARALKNNLNFRRVDYDNKIGRVNMLCSFAWSEDDRMTGFCPIPALEADVRMGAASKYRHEGGREYWLGTGNRILVPLTSSREFDPDVEVRNLILHSMQQKLA